MLNNNKNQNSDQQNKIPRPKPTPKKLPDDFNKSDFSQDSIEVLEYFGLEAPTLLNDFAVALEDALIEVSEKYISLKKENQKLQEKQK